MRRRGRQKNRKKPKADREKWKHGERGRRRYEWGRKDRVGRERRARLGDRRGGRTRKEGDRREWGRAPGEGWQQRGKG